MNAFHLLAAAAASILAACATASDGTQIPPAVASPVIPDTEIFLGRIARDGEGLAVAGLANVTNHKGYDNQPYFAADGKTFYFVSEGESGKTDIYRHDLELGVSEAIFVSPEASEFSPKEAPGGGISYIQENPAGDVTRVYRRKVGDGSAVADFEPVGYYAWLDDGAALAVYYRSEPGSLYRVEVASGATALIREAIGRAMQADGDGEHLWFTVIAGDEPPAFQLMRYDAASGAVADLFPLPDGAQDFALDFDASGAADAVFSASGSTLFRRSLRRDAPDDWVAVGDLATAGISAATRIAVSSDGARVAIVDEVAQ